MLAQAIRIAGLLLLLAITSSWCGVPAGRCPTDWVPHGDSCYLSLKSAMAYVEAALYCAPEGRPTSIGDKAELDFLVQLTGGQSTWIGLVRLNPCRIPHHSRRDSVCYRWADRSGFYNGFPSWHPGHPDVGDTMNCVALRGEAMEMKACSEKLPVVCKKAAAPGR